MLARTVNKLYRPMKCKLWFIQHNFCYFETFEAVNHWPLCQKQYLSKSNLIMEAYLFKMSLLKFDLFSSIFSIIIFKLNMLKHVKWNVETLNIFVSISVVFVVRVYLMFQINNNAFLLYNLFTRWISKCIQFYCK